MKPGLPTGLDRLRAMEKAATAGPWTDVVVPMKRAIVATRDGVVCDLGGGVQRDRFAANAALIAALRNCAPELLAVVETAQALDTFERRLQAGGSAGYGESSRLRLALGDALAALDARMKEAL